MGGIRQRERTRAILSVLFVIVLFVLLISAVGFFPQDVGSAANASKLLPMDCVFAAGSSSPAAIVSKLKGSVYYKKVQTHQGEGNLTSRIIENLSVEEELSFLHPLIQKYLSFRSGLTFIWDSRGRSIEGAQSYYMLDIGLLPSFIFSRIGIPQRLLAPGETAAEVIQRRDGFLIEKRINESDENVYYIYGMSKMIICRSLSDAEKIIDYYSSKTSSLEDRFSKGLEGAQESGTFFFYLNSSAAKERFSDDSLERRGYPSLSLLNNREVLCFASLNKNYLKLDAFLNYGDSVHRNNIYTLFSTAMPKHHQQILPDNTIMYFTISFTGGTKFFEDFSAMLSKEERGFFKELYTTLVEYRDEYPFFRLLSGVQKENSLAVIDGKQGPAGVLLLNVVHGQTLINGIERDFMFDKNVMKKELVEHEGKTITTFNKYGSNVLNYCAYDKKYYFSHSLSTIKGLITKLKESQTLASANKELKQLSSTDRNAYLYINFMKYPKFLERLQFIKGIAPDSLYSSIIFHNQIIETEIKLGMDLSSYEGKK